MYILQIVIIRFIDMRLYLLYRIENNSGKNMPEYELRDNLDRLPKVIYFTDSFLGFTLDRKGNAFYCIML